jgi:hypothetical protein
MHAHVRRGWVVDYKVGVECSGSQPGGAGKAHTAHPVREVEPKQSGDEKKGGGGGMPHLGSSPPSTPTARHQHVPTPAHCNHSY